MNRTTRFSAKMVGMPRLEEFVNRKGIPVAMVLVAALLSLAMTATAPAAADRWEAPSKAAARPNPEAKNLAAPANGRRSFLQACINCHGEDGSGEGSRAADLRSASVQSQTDGALFWKITNGNTANGMPSFAGLPETDRWDIVVFLRTLKQ